MRVLALDQAHVDRQPRRLGEAVEEGGGEVRAQPAGLRRGQVRVGDDERPLRDFDDDHRQRLLGRRDAESAAGGAVACEQRPERLPERGSGSVDLGLGLVRRDLEPDLEPAGGGELAEQVVEDGDARGDAARAVTAADLGRALLHQSSARSIEAPSARRRSSMRS